MTAAQKASFFLGRLISWLCRHAEFAATAWEATLSKKITELEVALEEERAAREKAELQISIDPLTKILNRRGYENLVYPLVNNYTRHADAADPFIVLMFDLDNFKKANDTRGHKAGDKILCAVAKRLKKTFSRESDVVSRCGGDEFLVAIQCPLSDAAELAEVARREIEKIEIVKICMGISASIGMAVYTRNTMRLGKNIDYTKVMADAAMYAAKKGGGNQICVSMDGEIYPLREAPLEPKESKPRGGILKLIR